MLCRGNVKAMSASKIDLLHDYKVPAAPSARRDVCIGVGLRVGRPGSALDGVRRRRIYPYDVMTLPHNDASSDEGRETIVVTSIATPV